MNNFISKIEMVCPECKETFCFNFGCLDNQIFPDKQYVRCLKCNKVYEFRFELISENAAQQSAHPTLGIRATFQAFIYAVKSSVLTAFRRPSQRG